MCYTESLSNMLNHIFKVFVTGIILVFVTGIILVLVGCSHNPAGLIVGKKIKLGTTEYEMSYHNGIGFIDIPRENSSWEIEINDQDGLQWDAESQTLKGVKKIKRTVGRQVTGYLVKLAKESPDAAKIWLGERAKDAETTENESECEEAKKELATDTNADCKEEAE